MKFCVQIQDFMFAPSFTNQVWVKKKKKKTGLQFPNCEQQGAKLIVPILASWCKNVQIMSFYMSVQS